MKREIHEKKHLYCILPFSILLLDIICKKLLTVKELKKKEK